MTSTSLIIAALFRVAKTWKQLRHPSRRERSNQPWSSHTMEPSPAGREKEQAADPSHNTGQSHKHNLSEKSQTQESTS